MQFLSVLLLVAATAAFGTWHETKTPVFAFRFYTPRSF